MKRKIGIGLVAVLVALSLTSLSFAAVKQATGEVVSINQAMKSIVVWTQGQELAFSVEEKAAPALTGLKPGDMVTVQYTEADGKRIAKAIKKS
jgi:hypothetical protein